MPIFIKRVYAPAAPEDGYRILVDRLWPRGMAKAKAAVDWWDKEIAPSAKLRIWFGHSPARWEEFQKLYTDELKNNPQAVEEFKTRTRGKTTLTLLYAAKDQEHTHALVLQEFLQENPA